MPTRREIARQLNRKVNEIPRKILHFAQLHNQRRQGAADLWIKMCSTQLLALGRTAIAK
jgi:hypothetical protein